jgi:hypothetical protein
MHLEHRADEPMPPNMITEEQIQRLTALGMVWRALPDKTWEDFYQDLLDFKREHGHVNVPQMYPQNRKLGSWVHRNRRLKKAHERGNITPIVFPDERQRLLQGAGFVWMTKPTPKRDWSKTKMKSAEKTGQQASTQSKSNNDNMHGSNGQGKDDGGSEDEYPSDAGDVEETQCESENGDESEEDNDSDGSNG